VNPPQNIKEMPFASPAANAPIALKTRVLTGIDGKISPPKPAQPVVPEPPIFPAWVPWTLLACLALLCIGLLGLSSGWRRHTRELNGKLEQAQQAYADLQREQEALQTRFATTGSNLVGKVAELEKQLVEKSKEGEKQKIGLQKQLEKASSEVFGAQRQAALFQNQLRVANREIDRLRGLPPGTTVPDETGMTQLHVGILKPTTDGPATASASSIWDVSEQKGLLVIENLPPLPPDRDYQLWLFDSKALGPISGGVFSGLESGSARFQFRTPFGIESGDKAAISIERKGGVNAPEGKFIMATN